MSRMPISKRTLVKCHSGWKADERPISFSVEGKEIMVRGLAERWYEPECACFRVFTASGESWLLRHFEAADEWVAAPLSKA